MRQHSGAFERKWNRQLTRPIFPAGAKNAVWKRDYSWQWCSVNTESNEICPTPTWVVMESALFQLQFIDATKTILVQETLNRLDHIQLGLSVGLQWKQDNMVT